VMSVTGGNPQCNANDTSYRVDLLHG
jgi:hypothetical protein